MVALDTRSSAAPTQTPRDDRPREATPQAQPQINVSTVERGVSVASGALLAILGLKRRSLGGLIIAGLGGALLKRGVTGHCEMYESLGLNTAQEGDEQSEPRDRAAKRGVQIERSFLIDRSPEDLYGFWRKFDNLPQIMTHLKEVRVIDDRRSHWVASAPAIAGGSVEWDAQITDDEPNSRIAWRSLPGSTVDSSGEVRFTRALGDRGTQVTVSLKYVPPGGRLGHWTAKLFGEAADQQIQEDLRRVKRQMETGEIPTTEGQPRGTCTGSGKRERN
ncbi:MAG TPA: SRPBCC family protein [Humisphaera sp.]|jgi:uncharacterized membrane protein|nr:SRPBCC family protein [Humisphaera sp.]